MTKKTLQNYILNLIKRIVDDDFPGMASEMAFMFVIGIFPFMLLLMSLFAWLGKKSLLFPVIDYLSTVAPNEAIALIKKVLNEVIIFEHGGIIAIAGFFMLIFLSSNIFAVIIKGLNRAYGIPETRNFFQTRFLSVIMIFVNAFLLFISINLVIFGKIIMEFILNYTALPGHIVHIILVTRWPFAFLSLYAMTFINYYFLPCIHKNNRARRKSVMVGSLFFTFCWLLGSWSFSVYLDRMNTYNKVYGTIGAVAILMVWLYYTSILLLIGGEMNSQVYRRFLVKKH